VKILLGLAVAWGTAHAEPVTLRMATIAPEGTAWARLLRTFSREVETLTQGSVKVKWYLSAIAGDELQVLERIRRGQLDGQAGTMFCDRLAPSLRVMHVIGLYRSHDEAIFVMSKLQPTLEREFQQNGFVDLGTGGGFGETVFFLREPARNLAELRRGRYWIWNLDEVAKVQLPAMGIGTVPTPVEEAARAYDEKRSDGFLSIPTGALAYQWSTQTRYFVDLHAGFLPGCLTISNTAFDALTLEAQRAVRQVSAKFLAHFEEIGREQSAQLLNGLFEKQGLRRIEPSPAFREEFVAAADQAREQLGAQVAPPPLMQRVLGWLAEHRAAHARLGATR
jgi:TRAP-type C4-dicarboxylate transport system substrate-binding protein